MELLQKKKTSHFLQSNVCFTPASFNTVHVHGFPSHAAHFRVAHGGPVETTKTVIFKKSRNCGSVGVLPIICMYKYIEQ